MKFEEIHSIHDESNECGEIIIRTEILGGWLVCRMEYNQNFRTQSMVFVPDTNHEWVVETE